MKPILVSFIIASFTTAALAQSAGTTLSMTCAAARRSVEVQGAAVLRTGAMTYDRYVRDGRFCERQETAQPAWVRTADTARCHVGAVCRSIDIDNGR